MPMIDVFFLSLVTVTFLLLAAVLAWGTQRTSDLFEHWD